MGWWQWELRVLKSFWRCTGLTKLNANLSWQWWLKCGRGTVLNHNLLVHVHSLCQFLNLQLSIRVRVHCTHALLLYRFFSTCSFTEVWHPHMCHSPVNHNSSLITAALRTPIIYNVYPTVTGCCSASWKSFAGCTRQVLMTFHMKEMVRIKFAALIAQCCSHSIGVGLRCALVSSGGCAHHGICAATVQLGTGQPGGCRCTRCVRWSPPPGFSSSAVSWLGMGTGTGYRRGPGLSQVGPLVKFSKRQHKVSHVGWSELVYGTGSGPRLKQHNFAGKASCVVGCIDKKGRYFFCFWE